MSDLEMNAAGYAPGSNPVYELDSRFSWREAPAPFLLFKNTLCSARGIVTRVIVHARRTVFRRIRPLLRALSLNARAGTTAGRAHPSALAKTVRVQGRSGFPND